MRPFATAARAVATVTAGLALSVAAAQPAIVDSVEELRAAFANGGDYAVMPGEYVLSEPVVVRSDLELEGVNRDSVLVQVQGAPIAVRIEGDVDVSISGMRLVYDGEAGADLIVVSGARLTLREADVGFARVQEPSASPLPGREDGHGSGIALIDGASLVGHDLRVARNQLAAIEARSGARVQLVDSVLTANYQGLVAVGGGVTIEVRGGSVSGHYLPGVILDAPDVVATFQDVEFFDNGVVDLERDAFWPGIAIGGTARVTFDGGVMRDMPSSALLATGAAQVALRGVTVQGSGGRNEAVGQTWRALQTLGNARLAIEDATLAGNPGGAISADENSSLTLTRVRVEGNGDWAHTSLLGAATAVIQDGVFVANEGALLTAGGATLGLSTSEISGSAGYGLVVGAQGAASVVNSRIADNASDGVWVDGGAALDLRTTQIVGNQVGVFVSGEATATLAGNEIVDNVRAGVVASDASRADLQGNTIARTPIGVHLSSTAAVQGADNVFAEVGQQVLDGR